ncbi:MAG TPA: hypothetical protein VGF02_04405 [Pseudolabrys sp.]|jgi:hypothetical protein
MGKKCILSAAVMFVMAWALSFVVHEFLLGADYAAVQGMRPHAEMEKLVPFIIAAHAIFGAAFAWVYLQGKEDKPWLMQGLRFGVAVACLAVAPIYLIYYAVTPVAPILAMKQIVFDTIRVSLMGVTLAWMNR